MKVPWVTDSTIAYRCVSRQDGIAKGLSTGCLPIALDEGYHKDCTLSINKTMLTDCQARLDG
jgi:hypothetical protein